MSDLDDSFEISKVRNKRLSTVLKLEFEDNDDTQEKKAQNRRNSTMLELETFTRNVNNPTKPHALTTDELDVHYGTCMKLASENKITTKNAFDLHLIEYLKNYMHSLASLQKASSELDAGGKIYAVRVDLVHSTTYNMFSTCGTGTNTEEPNTKDVPEDIVEDIDDKTPELKTRKLKKRVDVHKNMICTNIRKIRLTSAQIRSEVDPLSQSLVTKYDEGGSKELGVNNLKLLDEKLELLLDFSNVVKTRNEDNNFVNDIHLDLSDFNDTFNEIANGNVNIASGFEDFEDFKFMGWDSNTDVMNSAAVVSFRNLKLKDEQKNNHVDMEEYFGGGGEDNNYGGGGGDDDDYFDGGNDDNFGGGGGDENFGGGGGDDHFGGDFGGGDIENHIGDVVMNSKIADEEKENYLLKIGTSRNDNGSSLFVSSVKELVNSYMENYGEINDNILGMWAGPEHWKKKAKPIKEINDGTNKPRIIKPHKVKVIAPMFAEWVPTRLNADGIGRLVDIHLEDENDKSSKTSTQLTDNCLNNNIKKEYVLPPRSQFVFKSINQLMNRDVSLVNKALKKQAEQITNMGLGDERSEGHEDNNANANDVFEIAPIDMLVVNDNGDISNHDQGYDDDDGGYVDNDDPYTGRSFVEDNFEDFGGQMADGIRNPDPVGINYAKTAKAINVKRLKRDIVSFCKEKIQMIDLAEVNKKAFPNLHVPGAVCKFSNLLSYLDENVSPEVSKELSVSIVMTCMLLLVNETGIDISNTEDYSDLILGQGYSDYDLEQIKIYGIGNNLSHNRKRHSIDNYNLGSAKASKISEIHSDCE